MPELVVFRNEVGKLEGLGDKGRRAFAKFTKIVSELDFGETLHFSWRMPRSPAHHKYFFLKFTGLFERQERFDDFERLLDWLKTGAGYCDLLPGHDGVPCAIPKSIAWHNPDEQDFIEVHRAITDFLWQPYAQAALWPTLDDHQRYVCIDSWHRDFERP